MVNSVTQSSHAAAVESPVVHVTGLLMVMIGTLLFSSKSILIQWLFSLGVGLEQLMLMRMLLSLPLYVLIGYFGIQSMRRRGRPLPSWRDYTAMAFAGMLCYHVAAYMDMWALQQISAGLERTILFSYPLMIAVIQHFREQRLHQIQWLSLCVAYLGIWLFYHEDQRLLGDDILWGALAVLFAAALTAYYILASQHFTRRYHSDLFTAAAMGATAFSITGHVSLFAPTFVWVFSLPILVGVVVLACCCTVLASVLVNRGIAASGAVYGSIAGMVGPLITVALSAVFLGTPITIRHIFALLLVVLGVMGVQMLSPKKG